MQENVEIGGVGGETRLQNDEMEGEVQQWRKPNRVERRRRREKREDDDDGWKLEAAKRSEVGTAQVLLRLYLLLKRIVSHRNSKLSEPETPRALLSLSLSFGLCGFTFVNVKLNLHFLYI